jgi:phage-related protein
LSFAAHLIRCFRAVALAPLVPSDFKPMLNVGAGAYDVRLHVPGEWRVIYVAKFDNAVYVLHAFHKKTQKTARKTSSWRRDVIDRSEAES